MQLAIERSTLLKSLAHIQNVVERRTTIPILGNVKLEAGKGELRLTATDLDLELAIREPAAVTEPGTTTVAAHTLFEIVRKLPEGCEVTLSCGAGANELTLRAARSRFELPTLPADEFPALGEDELPVAFALPAPLLQRLIDKVRFAMSTEETRYYLNGIHFHVLRQRGGGLLRAVATDGHRLARIEAELPAGADGLPPIIVPRKTVGEMRKLVDGREGNVDVEVSTSRIRLKVDGSVLTSRLIDGQFPDYERVIPKSAERVAVLETRPFAQAVDRVSTISTERMRAVKLSFANGQVVLSSISPESGRASDELDVEYSGEPLEIGFNARYILDMLDEIDGEQVRFEMTSAAAPTVVRDPADPGVLFVLMPMRV